MLNCHAGSIRAGLPGITKSGCRAASARTEWSFPRLRPGVGRAYLVHKRFRSAVYRPTWGHMLGAHTLENNSGVDNTTIGLGALASNTTAALNTATGCVRFCTSGKAKLSPYRVLPALRSPAMMDPLG